MERDSTPKVAVIGAGNVGSTTAQRIVERSLADVVLFDIVDGMPQGKALDIQESAPLEGFDCSIVGTNKIEDVTGSDVVVITAGLARQPGMSRLDLLKKNAEIVGGICEKLRVHTPQAIIVMVTNPLDVMTQLAWDVTQFSNHRVLGMAGVLDSARFRAFIAMELNVSMRDVEAMVLGGHGDSMVPLARFSTVSGVGISALLPKAAIDRIIERTRNGGGEIVNLLKKGSAYYAPASSVATMAQSILRDEKRILPCCALTKGEYGVHDVYVGVPVKLGKRGVEEIIQLELTKEELAALRKSAEEVKSSFAELGR